MVSYNHRNGILHESIFYRREFPYFVSAPDGWKVSHKPNVTAGPLHSVVAALELCSTQSLT
jgi:hypothetical protein